METERLRLAEWEEGDWIDFRPIATDSEVMRYIGTGAIWSDDRIQSFVARQIEGASRFGFCLWKLVEKESNRLVGFCGLQHLGTTGSVEIGWWLARDRWGRGLATEAARCALRYGFTAASLPRIVAIAQPENHSSIHIMEKLGMKFQELIRHGELGKANPEIPIVHYAIDRPNAEASPVT
jgi:ribosomal-protein-alanine N-acetyltransferase